jgi:hypothetical protein
LTDLGLDYDEHLHIASICHSCKNLFGVIVDSFGRAFSFFFHVDVSISGPSRIDFAFAHISSDDLKQTSSFLGQIVIYVDGG